MVWIHHLLTLITNAAVCSGYYSGHVLTNIQSPSPYKILKSCTQRKGEWGEGVKGKCIYSTGKIFYSWTRGDDRKIIAFTLSGQQDAASKSDTL